jgi:hypothetical protein
VVVAELVLQRGHAQSKFRERFDARTALSYNYLPRLSPIVDERVEARFHVGVLPLVSGDLITV